jgi:hypothetical protein
VSGIYAAGGSGVFYTSDGATTTGTSIASNSSYGVEINGTQLYATTTGAPGGVVTVGGATLPTSSGQTIALLPGETFSGTSGAGVGYSREFAFATLNGGTTPDTLYVADSYNDGVDKLSLVNGSWVLNGEIGAYPLGGTPLAGTTGILALPVAGGEQLFITTSTSTTTGATSKLYTITDPYGYNSVGGTAGTQGGGVFSANPPLTLLATAGANEAFRGLQFVPQPSGAPTVFTQPVSLPAAVNGSNATLTSIASGVNVAVQWEVSTNGGASYSPIPGATFTTLSVPASLSQPSNMYIATFTNAAGSVNSSAATITVIPGPQISFSVASASVPSTYGSITIDVHRIGDLTGGGTNSGTDTVHFNTASGTAVAGTNFTTTSTTLTFPNDGTTTDQYVTVPIIYVPGSNASSPTLTFTVNLSGVTGTNAVLGTTSETISILPPQETVSVSSAAYTVDSSNTAAIVSIVRAGTITSDTGSVPYTITGIGADTSLSASGTATFAANQSVYAVTVPLNGLTTGNFNVSLGTFSGTTNFTTGGAILGAVNSATGTIVTPTSLSAPGNLNGSAGSVTDIETTGPYAQSYAPVVGDTGAGTGSFAYLAYEVLEFSPTADPNLYPAPGTVVNNASTGITSMTLSMYNTDATSGTSRDNYGGIVGNFDVYFLPDSDATTATSSLTYSTTTPTGLLSTQFKTSPVLIGQFSFDNVAGYETYTQATIPTTVKNDLIADLNGTATPTLPTTFPSPGLPFRLAVTPVATGTGSIAADWRGFFSGETPTLSLATNQTVVQHSETVAFSSSSYTVNEAAGTATIQLVRSGIDTSDQANVFYSTSNGNALAGTNYTATSGYANFAAGSLTTSFNVSIANLVPQGGDKTLNLTLGNTSTGGTHTGTLPTFAILGTPTTATLTIVDSSAANTETLQPSIYDAADVEKNGPYVDSEIKAEGSSGGYPSFGVADFFGATPASTVTAIDSITLSMTNEADVAAGPVDFYLVADTVSNIAPSSPQSRNPHYYNTTQGGEGLGSQFGAKFLLGTYNITDTGSGDVVSIPLVTFGADAEAALISYLNDGGLFRIVATPESATVNGDFISSDAAISIKVQEASDASSTVLPPWLAPGSSAIFSPSSETLEVTGPATIIGNPAANGNTGVVITANGSSAVLSIDVAASSQVSIGSISLTGGASASLAGSSHVVLVTSGLFIDTTSSLNLGNGFLDDAGGNLGNVTGFAANGYNSANWNGTGGIYSSVAGSDSTHLTALGVIQNNQSGTALFTSSNFDGVTPGASDILVAYTYYGDANLSGVVNGLDYTRVDNAYLNNKNTSSTALTGWYNGDFNYDGVINSSDFTLIDNAFNTQGSALPAAELESGSKSTRSGAFTPLYASSSQSFQTQTASTTVEELLERDKSNTLLATDLLDGLKSN